MPRTAPANTLYITYVWLPSTYHLTNHRGVRRWRPGARALFTSIAMRIQWTNLFYFLQRLEFLFTACWIVDWDLKLFWRSQHSRTISFLSCIIAHPCLRGFKVRAGGKHTLYWSRLMVSSFCRRCGKRESPRQHSTCEDRYGWNEACAFGTCGKEIKDRLWIIPYTSYSLHFFFFRSLYREISGSAM